MSGPAVLLMVVLVASPAAGENARGRGFAKQVVVEPDPRQARRHDREPTEAELRQFERLLGRRRADVLLTFDHPSAVEWNETDEVWIYRYGNSRLVVSFRRGVVRKTTHLVVWRAS
jgi:hypothetical protein